MELLRRNTTEFEYLPYTGEESDLNSDGDHTGEFYPVYGDPVKYRGNISTPGGMANQTFYGEDIRYTHVLVMKIPKEPISEHGVIRWKARMYDIRAVRQSLNSLSIALRKQTENHAEPYEPDEPEEPDVPETPGEPEDGPSEAEGD